MGFFGLFDKLFMIFLFELLLRLRLFILVVVNFEQVSDHMEIHEVAHETGKQPADYSYKHYVKATCKCDSIDQVASLVPDSLDIKIVR